MKRIETSLPGVFIIEPRVFEDDRGFFFESYREDKYAELGVTVRFVQSNHSRSVQGTLRGLHYQLHRPQAKLCRVIKGEVLDVAVDIRVGSPNFGKFVAAKLSEENKRQIYIPSGFAHGFLVLSKTAEFLYKCSDYYFPEYDRGIFWNDPEIGIDWQISNPLLSGKDRKLRELCNLGMEELPTYNGDD
jgi:dTDP-4-dehydrorhamnose 3,5-epimerase